MILLRSFDKPGILHSNPQFLAPYMKNMESVHKYLDIVEYTVILAVYHIIMELNNVYELKLQTYRIKLRNFTSKTGD